MEKEKPDKTLFEELKAIRIEKKVKLEDIAKSSRIQLEYLRALEEGDLIKIPEVYDKLFFRSYLKNLKVDVEYYYNEFIEYRKRIRVDKTTTLINFGKHSETDRKIINYRNLFVILPLLIVILVIWLLIRNTEIIDTKPKEVVQEIDIKSIIEEMQSEEKSLEKEVTPEEVQTKLKLDIKGLEKTWFRVVIDKRDTSEYLLNKGDHINLTANGSFEFLIGRADGLNLNLNGNDLSLLGPDSMVVSYMLVDSSGIAVKRLKKPTGKK